MQLTPTQLDAFQANGFLVVDQICTPDEISWLRDLYDEVFDRRIGENEGRFYDVAGPRGHQGDDYLPQALAPEQTYPQLRETTFWRNATALGAQLLGVPEPATTVASDMVLKPAGRGRETPWHQDEAYWDGSYEHSAVSVWMPLEDATVAGGCMHFVPGSHRGRIAVHRHLDDDPTVHALVAEAHSQGAVACPVRAGSATIHHCRTMHYAGPNTTDSPRRAYIVRVRTTPTLRDAADPRPWLDEERKALAQRT